MNTLNNKDKLKKAMFSVRLTDDGVRLKLIYISGDYTDAKTSPFMYTKDNWCVTRGDNFAFNINTKVMVIPKTDTDQVVDIKCDTDEKRYDVLKTFRDILLEFSESRFFMYLPKYGKRELIYRNAIWTLY